MTGSTIYVHVPGCYGTPLTFPIKLNEEESKNTSMGLIKEALSEEFRKRNGPYSLPEHCQFVNEFKHPIKDESVVSNLIGTDFILKQKKLPMKQMPDNIHPDILEAQKNAAEKLADRIANTQNANPKSAPVKLKTNVKKPLYNSRASPFGTDLEKYHTLEKYTYEDKTGMVKVYIPFEGVGTLPKENIICNFGPRQFELLVNNAQDGKNYRFACGKTHGLLNYEECTYSIRDKRVVLNLKKELDSCDSWYELFKTRAVGEKEYEA